ncbi:methylase involved in ubiquinone/menaquinone biosynthesis [Halogeometricum borinquense DSM 11551]|uniref:Methylase involved in ubiquinone/menaquinone biosynthesis n=2 Tax=Halogeometricum borinquense TaxID=60847 RepID=E4NT86_HALBP|nr:class I SAM-dependent methyltransferase [Halogeometricum borinquense]ADQ68183.1 methylase involved in ubiquinone/menaquinone biosynthesis [Halogeometricum borinquense DSM 11551]ELY24773.1 methylase involved in ubiquinone/menaquinone biosynthesis [Halogeometricum borinquense DSM 11551]RYJ12918.1 class I SAM-dependent methyltransferase [Halogeometricum borinquense]
MRKFSPEYLRRTREGMWDDSRDALQDLSLPDRSRVLDVGCGTGELSRVLDAETPGEVVCLDADPELLRVAREAADLPTVVGDATRLPFPDDTFDLVVCQALLVNLPRPTDAIESFTRASSDLVAAVEPDNAAVGVDSTVSAEVALERSVRESYMAGVQTDVALGDRLPDIFESVGLCDVRTRRYFHRKLIEPPYDDAALEDAARKANGTGLAAHETELRRTLSDDEYDALRRDWREMGRTVVEQMQDERYRRAEVVPFDVVVGRVPE